MIPWLGVMLVIVSLVGLPTGLAIIVTATSPVQITVPAGDHYQQPWESRHQYHERVLEALREEVARGRQVAATGP